MAPVLADPQQQRWGDLRLRVASAALLAPLALICIWAGGVAYAVLIAVAAAGSVWEWVQMDRARRSGAVPLLGGLAYILLAAAGLLWLRFDPLVGRLNLVFLLLLVWASDIGAYIAGRAIGGPRIAPRISPGKTVSGAVGGLIAAILVGMIAALASSAGLWRACVIAGGLGLIAQGGDLLESLAKRHFGVKDSGRLIPGHGGLLDRLDALLAVALAAALLALLEGPGVVLWQ